MKDTIITEQDEDGDWVPADSEDSDELVADFIEARFSKPPTGDG